MLIGVSRNSFQWRPTVGLRSNLADILFFLSEDEKSDVSTCLFGQVGGNKKKNVKKTFMKKK